MAEKQPEAKKVDDSFRAVRDRALSLWQSAAEEVSARAAASKSPPATKASLVSAPRTVAMAAQPGLDLEAARLNLAEPAAATALAVSFDKNRQLPTGAAAPHAAVAGIGGTLSVCAKLAFQLAWAKAHGDTVGAQQILDNENFSNCSPNWAETVEQFLLYYQLNHGNIPYRSGGNYVLDDIPSDATIAIIGDWGTGTEAATRLLQQVARKNPQVVLHLGDIYYAGTPAECQSRFLTPCKTLLADSTRVYTLSGNHDMYSGGVGYYGLVDQFQQQASYFCFGNNDWQFLAMDTGYSDFNPTPWMAANVEPTLTPVEAAWHADKIEQAGNRKTVLLSHHQPFSAYESIAGQSANEKLLKPFKDRDLLDKIALWFWGHEHLLAIYDSYEDIARGRCVGCSAIPVFAAENPYKVNHTDVPLLNGAQGGPIRPAVVSGVYNRGYAIMKLDGPKATISYYQDSDETNALYVETFE